MKLRSVKFDIGAGKCDLDLRGTPQKSYRVDIHGGVGEANVYVPREVGVVARLAGELGRSTSAACRRKTGVGLARRMENLR